jgi:predicted Zn-dependent peptidase
MRRAIRFILATLPLLGAMTTPLAAQKVAVVEKRLGNGTGPYSCGARASDSRGRLGRPRGQLQRAPRITGISPLFEHMMFKGTPTMGTSR